MEAEMPVHDVLGHETTRTELAEVHFVLDDVLVDFDVTVEGRHVVEYANAERTSEPHWRDGLVGIVCFKVLPEIIFFFEEMDFRLSLRYWLRHDLNVRQGDFVEIVVESGFSLDYHRWNSLICSLSRVGFEDS
jgi:hypothetical protein